METDGSTRESDQVLFGQLIRSTKIVINNFICITFNDFVNYLFSAYFKERFALGEAGLRTPHVALTSHSRMTSS